MVAGCLRIICADEIDIVIINILFEESFIFAGPEECADTNAFNKKHDYGTTYLGQAKYIIDSATPRFDTRD